MAQPAPPELATDCPDRSGNCRSTGAETNGSERRIFLALQPSDPHVSLPTLALERADVAGVAPERSLGALLSVIEVNVLTHDHDKYSEKSL